jgi:hypothetical protein
MNKRVECEINSGYWNRKKPTKLLNKIKNIRKQTTMLNSSAEEGVTSK